MMGLYPNITGLKMPTGAGLGKALISDANGVGTWTNLSTLYLPLTAITNTNHYTGFPNRTATSISWADGTGTLTLTATDDKIWISGVEYEIDTLEKAFDDGLAEVAGLYWFWITAPGGTPQLNYGTTVADHFGQCLVAAVYWNTTTNKGLLFDERHWMGRDKWMHEYLHETVGARFAHGMEGTFGNDTFTIGIGEFYDEDIEHENDAETVATILYHNGDAAWKWDTAQTLPYKLSTGNLVYNDGNTLTEAAANRFVNYFFFMTGDTVDPVHIVIGTDEYTTLAAAQAAIVPSLGDLPGPENKLIFKVTYKNAGPPTWQHTIDYRNSSNLPSDGYVATDHGSLAGLADDDHPQYMLHTEHYNNPPNDWNADGVSEWIAWRPSAGDWFVDTAGGVSLSTEAWGEGALGDVPALFDIDGDGKVEKCIYRWPDNTFYYVRSSDSAHATKVFGSAGDILPGVPTMWQQYGLTGVYQYGGVHIGGSGSVADNNLVVDGKVGIGTSTPAAKLAINGGLHVGGDSDPGDNNLLVDGTLHVDGIQTSAGIVMDDGATIGQAAGPLVAFDDTNNYLEITGTGLRAGIGTDTPTTSFQVAQGTAGIGTVTVTTNTTCTGTGTQFLNTFKVGDSIILTTNTETRAITAIASDTVMTIASATNVVGSSYTLAGRTIFSVLGNGNVGIGTTAPVSLCEIQGGLTTTGAVLTLSSSEPSTVLNDILGRINFRAALDAAGTDAILTAASIAAVAENTFSASVNETGLAFYTGASEVAVERMRIDHHGNVGIGATSFGTSAATVLGIFNGTEPSSSPADMVQLYSVDLSAGNATLGLRTETAVVTETVTSDRTLSVRINGTTYKLCLKA